MKRHNRMPLAPTAGGRRREAQALIVERPGPSAEIVCPFCFPRHPLVVGQPAKCGTVLELKAVQRLYTAVACGKCGKTNGTLVKRGDNYQHAQDCMPGKLLLAEDPVPSRWAAIVYRMPPRLKVWIENRRGSQVATRLQGQDGKVVYSWLQA